MILWRDYSIPWSRFLVLMCLSNATDLQLFCCFRIYVVSFPFMKLVWALRCWIWHYDVSFPFMKLVLALWCWIWHYDVSFNIMMLVLNFWHYDASWQLGIMSVGFDPALGRDRFFLTSFNSLRPLRVRFREGLGLGLVYFLKFDLDISWDIS